MQIFACARLRSATSLVVIALTAAFVAGCATSDTKVATNSKKRSKEYFAETEYGVKASPRVAYGKTNLRRGGGRDQIGKPYKVRGRMYYPKEVKGYTKVGMASWYGDAFHGRLTANGEVYDMTHLTAAHPTMPLPSYARVTNTENGNSVIVRVNDRGPYSHNRLIDLSSRAADMLDYKRSGTAKVKVDYIGRAPVDGRDDSYLLASYRPGNRAPNATDGLPDGVMIAMNGPTPSDTVAAPAGFPGEMLDTTQTASGPTQLAEMSAGQGGEFPLPAFGPIAPERPVPGEAGDVPFRVASLGYAPDAGGMPQAFAALDPVSNQDWKRAIAPAGGASDGEPYVAAGTFTSAAAAKSLARGLEGLGRVSVEESVVDGQTWFSVDLRGDGRSTVDDMLRAAWDNGATDAIAVRD